jgi:hypothetical protein
LYLQNEKHSIYLRDGIQTPEGWRLVTVFADV